MDWTPIIIASIPGFASLLTVILQARKDRKTVDATATEIITNAAAKAVELAKKQADDYFEQFKHCRDELIEMKAKVAKLETTTDNQETAIDKLRAQVTTLGAVPANGH